MGEGVVDQGEGAALVVGVQEPLDEVHADQLAGAVAEPALGRRALVPDDRVGVDHQDDVGRVLDEGAEALLLVPHLGQQPLLLLRLPGEQVILLGELVGQGPVAEVQLPGQHDRAEEGDHRPDPVALERARDDHAEQAEPELGGELVQRLGAVHPPDGVHERHPAPQRERAENHDQAGSVERDRGEAGGERHPPG